MVNSVNNGVRDQIVNFQVPGWRVKVGPKVTVIVKGTNGGALSWALTSFDIVFPNDGPYAIACQIYAQQQARSTVYPDISKPAGGSYNSSGSLINLTADADGQYVPDAMTLLKARSGAVLGLIIEAGIAFDLTIPSGATDTYSSSNEPYRARALARLFSACANAGHPVFNAMRN